MAKYICDVNFDIQGNLDDSSRRDRKLKDKLRDEYMRLREKAVELTNPKLDLWNSEFDHYYGEEISPIDDPDVQRCYDEFIAEKMNSVLQTLDSASKLKGFVLRCDPELDCEFVGVYEFRGKAARVYMSIAIIHAV